jgi:hypothetical protein
MGLDALTTTISTSGKTLIQYENLESVERYTTNDFQKTLNQNNYAN